jgi:predicted DNA-binding transcriptional regulator AlpA
VTTATLPPADAPAPQLLDCRAVAALLACSARHWLRLVDSGRAPPPLRLGTLVRWPRSVIDDWIAAGCPAFRQERR